jgi:diaminopimelate epimerase
MIEIEIIVCHGSCNRFLIIDDAKSRLISNYSEEKVQKLSTFLSDFYDTDGVLFVLKNTLPCTVGKMKMHNRDGSEAEMCGNGIRCVGRFIYEKLNIETMTIETKMGTVDVLHNPDGTYSASINPVCFDLNSLPINTPPDESVNTTFSKIKLNGTFYPIGVQNPHLVTFVDEFDYMEIRNNRLIIENNKDIFPNSINVNYVKIIDEGSMFVVTDERGCGVTPACGTGMSAASYIACLHQGFSFGHDINVYNNGGKVVCRANKQDGSIELKGNASFVSRHGLTINIDNIDSIEIVNESKLSDYKDDGYLLLFPHCKLN